MGYCLPDIYLSKDCFNTPITPLINPINFIIGSICLISFIVVGVLVLKKLKKKKIKHPIPQCQEMLNIPASTPGLGSAPKIDGFFPGPRPTLEEVMKYSVVALE